MYVNQLQWQWGRGEGERSSDPFTARWRADAAGVRAALARIGNSAAKASTAPNISSRARKLSLSPGERAGVGASVPLIRSQRAGEQVLLVCVPLWRESATPRRKHPRPPNI